MNSEEFTLEELETCRRTAEAALEAAAEQLFGSPGLDSDLGSPNDDSSRP
jgi:hypothetical protein